MVMTLPDLISSYFSIFGCFNLLVWHFLYGCDLHHKTDKKFPISWCFAEGDVFVFVNPREEPAFAESLLEMLKKWVADHWPKGVKNGH